VHRVGRTARAGAAGTAIAFCSDEERPYLREIEKLTRCSLRSIPLAIPAPPAGAIEPPAKATLPREDSLASRQATMRGRAAPTRHPRPAGVGLRRRDPPAASLLPTLPRRPLPTKSSSVGRRSERRGRSM